MALDKGRILSPDDHQDSRIRCEYLVIGTGAGGSVAGSLLAQAGADVTFIEEGEYFASDAYTRSVSEMTSKLYRNGGVFPFLGSPHIAFAEGRCVGGGTVINGGLLWRTPEWVLEQWRDENGLTGYGYRDLERHFEAVEANLSVKRHALEENANLDSLSLHRGAQALGWKSVLVPRAVKNCVNSNFCPTGCVSGAKQSTIQTYLTTALKRGARIYTSCRARRIRHSRGSALEVEAVVSHGVKRRQLSIACDHLVLAAGAVQTPHLLWRSRISRHAGRSLEFHMNMKIVATFKDPLRAENGTIFTVQVQEFEREGLLMMASTMKPHYVATTLSHLPGTELDAILRNYDHAAIYAAMVRSRSKAQVISWIGGEPIVRYKFDGEDLPVIKSALRRTAQALFAGGAVELYLPIRGLGKTLSLQQLDRQLEAVEHRKMEITTVHAMSSCPMGGDASRSVVSPDGLVWGMNNVWVTDASVLPTNIGESPQGTIMAFAHEIAERRIASIGW